MRRSSITATNGSPRRRRLAGIPGYRKRLGAVEFDYLAVCQEAERLAQRRTRRVQVTVGMLVAVMVAGLVAWGYERPLKEHIYWFTDVRGQVLTPERERALKTKSVFRECTDCPEMIVVPAGNFTMGSTGAADGYRPYSLLEKPAARGGDRESLRCCQVRADLRRVGCLRRPRLL
jgi:hypothetical protein